ncbi:MAG: ribonuclease III [Phycisphaerae bacterium]|nr:ribonuclease III [Phycisphaerae bacterium]
MHNDRSEIVGSPSSSSSSPHPIGRGPGDESPEARAERKIGYVFKDRTPLTLALIHASVAGTRLESNERLEFLGDAILGMVICDYLFRTYPSALEGELTKVKSNVVSRRSCAEIAMELSLDEDLVLGKGMGGRENLPSSLAAAAFESVIGAIYLDGGLDAARTFVLRHMAPRIEQASRLGHQHNFKSVLQQALQRCGTSNPAYLVVDERGPDHAKCFNIAVDASGRKFPACWGTSKKQAEQQAALTALLELGFASFTSSGDIVVRRIESGEILVEAPVPAMKDGNSTKDPSRESSMSADRDNPSDAPSDVPPK